MSESRKRPACRFASIFKIVGLQFAFQRMFQMLVTPNSTHYAHDCNIGCCGLSGTCVYGGLGAFQYDSLGLLKPPAKRCLSGCRMLQGLAIPLLAPILARLEIRRKSTTTEKYAGKAAAPGR